MAIDISKYSEEIRKLCQEYYCRNIAYDEYKAKRDFILDNIESEMYGQPEQSDQNKDNILDIVKSCIKKLNPIE
jgi:2-oxoglutarate dehydrogenase complex dehydrogenase (E1) component-like enzyme